MQLKSVSIEKTTGTRSHYRMWKPESFPLLFPCRVTSTLIHLHGLYIEPIKTQYVSHAITVTINVGHSFLCFWPSLGEYLAYLEHCVCPAREGSVNHYHIGQYCNSRWIVAPVNHCDYSYRNAQKHKYQNLFCLLLNIQDYTQFQLFSLGLGKLPDLTFRKLLSWEYSV